MTALDACSSPADTGVAAPALHGLCCCTHVPCSAPVKHQCWSLEEMRRNLDLLQYMHDGCLFKLGLSVRVAAATILRQWTI